MAGYKETPRQKMIGMMYLVLTALLALNVSKEVLDAFVVVNEGLVKTNQILEEQNALQFTEFENQKALNEEKVLPYFLKADKAKNLSGELINYIIDLKRQVIAYTEFGNKDLYVEKYKDPKTKEYVTDSIVNMPLGVLKNKSSYDKPMIILLPKSENVKKGEAHVLKNKIIKYKKEMLNLLPEKDRKKMNLGLLTEDGYNKDQKKTMPWEYNTFYHMVLYGDIVLLNKFITEVYNAESDIVAKLYSNISAQDFKFDQIDAKVIPKSNFVITGDKYSADIFVAAYSTTETPEVYIKTGVDTLRVEDIGTAEKIPGEKGVVKYQVDAGAMGEKKYAGIIRLRKPGSTEFEDHFFKSDYVVAKPTAVVSPTKMNALYFGVENPIEISVSGFPASRIHANMSNGTLGRKGNEWIAKPSQATGISKISVSVTDDDGKSRSMGTKEFRLKRIPDPVAKIANKIGGTINRQVLASSAGIAAVYEGTLFDFRATVLSFVLYYRTPTGYQNITNSGNRFNPRMKTQLNKLRSGQKVTFENIKIRKQDGSSKIISDIVFNIR